ncbi:MAG: chromate transporter [bacterium]|nr:chromate transporter [bacterium]
MKKNPKIFLSFLKIGAFTIGGGFVMLPLIRQEVVDRRKWISEEQFMHFLTIAQSSPGVMAVNLSLAIGWEVNGFSGALSGLLGAVLPSFVSILLIAMLFLKYFESAWLTAFFKGAVPATSGVIGAVVFVLARKNLKSFSQYAALLVTTALLVFWQANPVLVIILGMVVALWVTYRRQV